MTQVSINRDQLSINVGDGVILALETVKLTQGDIGFRGVLWYRDVVYLATKLLPLGMGKPQNMKEARDLLDNLFKYHPENIYYYTPGAQIEYRI